MVAQVPAFSYPIRRRSSQIFRLHFVTMLRSLRLPRLSTSTLCRSSVVERSYSSDESNIRHIKEDAGEQGSLSNVVEVSTKARSFLSLSFLVIEALEVSFLENLQLILLIYRNLNNIQIIAC